MTDNEPQVPTMIRHYAAYLRANVHVTPETSVNGGKAEVRISVSEKLLVLIFGCRKRKWSLRTVEIRQGEQTKSFTTSELAKAIAALLGHQPASAGKEAISGTSGPQTDASLRERRNTVIRV